MPAEDQRKLQNLMDQVLTLMTSRPSAGAPAMRSAALDDAFSRLIKIIRPVLKPFLGKLREEKVDVPADPRVWSDPDRLRELVERMTPEQRAVALKQTEKILGMLAYS